MSDPSDVNEEESVSQRNVSSSRANSMEEKKVIYPVPTFWQTLKDQVAITTPRIDYYSPRSLVGYFSAGIFHCSSLGHRGSVDDEGEFRFSTLHQAWV